MDNGWIAVIVSVSVFVVGEFLVKLFVEPIIELRKTLGEVRYAINFYSNVYANPPLGRQPTPEDRERIDSCSKRFRDLAMELDSKHAVLLLPTFAGWIGLVPSPEVVEGARKELTYLSNSAGITPGVIVDYHARALLVGLGIGSKEDKKSLPELKKIADSKDALGY